MGEAISWGGDVDWHNELDEGKTPLHLATHQGDHLCADTLLLNSASAASPDMRGWIPIHYAAFHTDLKMITLLLLRGGQKQLSTKEFTGKLPKDICEEYNEDSA